MRSAVLNKQAALGKRYLKKKMKSEQADKPKNAPPERARLPVSEAFVEIERAENSTS